MEFEKIKESFHKLQTKRELLYEQREELLSKQDALADRLDNAEKAAIVIQKVGKETQQQLEFHISRIVSSALYAVDVLFPEFVTRFKIRRNQMECDLLFSENGKEYKPVIGSGGGPLDIGSFALHPTYWSLNKNRPSFLFDEPFKHLSPGYQAKASEMLKMLVDKLGIQVIIISHAVDIEEYADRIIYVQKVNDVSQISYGKWDKPEEKPKRKRVRVGK